MRFQLVHELTMESGRPGQSGKPGRLRARANAGFSHKWAESLQVRLENVPGLEQVRVNARVGSVLIFYTNTTACAAAVAVLCHWPSLLCLEKREKATPSRSLAPGFGPLVRYVVVRPFLPVLARIVTAFVAAWPYMVNGLRACAKGRINVDVLDATALGISLLRRDFRTVSLLTLLLGFGEALETWTRKSSQDSLTKSLALDIDTVWVRRNAEELLVPLQSLQMDDLVVVRAGAAIPVDGVVVTGEAVVNQSSMTGEALGVMRMSGDSVYAGTVVEEGELVLRTTSLGEETRLQRIGHFIEESQKLKAGVESRAMRLADAAVPFTFLLSGLVWLISRNSARAASVLLVDYACALRLATPLAVLSAMREGAGKGVLIKGGLYLEALAEADTVVFDKTGTLTASQPKVAEIVPAPGHSRRQILKLAACLEEHFPHPVARAVVRQAEMEDLHHREEHTAVEYVVAHGVASQWRGKRVLLGSRHYIHQDEGIGIQNMMPDIQRLTDQGMSLLYVAIDEELIGLIAIEDSVRTEAAQVVSQLRASGIRRVVMITGDDNRTAAAVAARLGIEEYYAEVLPINKAEIIRDLQAQACKVIMVGDGMNDAPALSAANVGVSLRDGADLAREVADVVLTDAHLQALVTARHLGQKTLQRIHRNFRLNMGLNSLFLGAGLMGALQPGSAAVLHNLTTVGVTLNAMRPMLTEKPTLELDYV